MIQRHYTLCHLVLWTFLCGMIGGIPLKAAEMPSEIYLAHTHPQTNAFDPVGVMSAYFKEHVEKRTNGAVLVHIFPDSRLGGNRELSLLVEKNIIQSAFVNIGSLTYRLPVLSVTQIPFAFENRAAAVSVLDGPFGQDLTHALEEKSGFLILGFGDPGGMNVISNSKRPITSPADLQGLKIRSIPGFSSVDAMITATGAKPVRVSSREEYAALGSGMIDGQMNPPSNMLGRRLDDVQKHVTLTNHLYSPYMWIFNQSTFDAFPADFQSILRQTAKEAVVKGRQEAEAWERSEWGLNLLRQRMKVVELSAAQRHAFAQATQPAVIKSLEERLPAEDRPWIQRFLTANSQILKSVRDKSPQ